MKPKRTLIDSWHISLAVLCFSIAFSTSFAGRYAQLQGSLGRTSLVPGLFRQWDQADSEEKVAVEESLPQVVQAPLTSPPSVEHFRQALPPAEPLPVEPAREFVGLSAAERARRAQKRRASAPAEPQAVVQTHTDTFDPLRQVIVAQLPDAVRLAVPFTAQAPTGEWLHPFDEACEESSLIMIEYYLRGEELNQSIAVEEIRQMVAWQTVRDYIVDIGAHEIATVAREYYQRRAAVYVGDEVTMHNIKSLLAAGYPVIIPVAGRELRNPHFQGAGPPYHVIVLTGYERDVFIAHEPGTRHGDGYRYREAVIAEAIHDWTGSKQTVKQGGKALVVLGR